MKRLKKFGALDKSNVMYAKILLQNVKIDIPPYFTDWVYKTNICICRAE